MTIRTQPPASGRRPGGAVRVSDRVADRILARIASGEWGPGQRLPGERTLAEAMGVSRVSVRAALQLLKARGLLDAVQGGGTRVISSAHIIDPGLAELVRVNRENLHDLAEIRAILEVWAVRRAAACATPDQIAEMAGIIRASEADSGGRHKTEHDIRFHLAVAKAAGSGIYLHVMAVFRGILQEMLDYHRYELFPTPEDDVRILEQHRAVFEAIRTRDGDGAVRAMKAHLDWVLERYAGQRGRDAAGPQGRDAAGPP